MKQLPGDDRLGSARRDAVDVARILALLVVVSGHLLLAVVDRPGGEVRAANLLALQPHLVWLAVLAPMPVFFAAGGWANATSGLARAAPRLRLLVGLAAVVVTVWSLAVGVVTLLDQEPGVVGDGARVATQPLWFLAAYLPLVAVGRHLARAAAARPAVAVGACLAGLALLDLARFSRDAPGWVGWPGFFLAWGVPWLLGAWWRDRSENATRFSERRAGATLLAGAGLVCVGLVQLLGYSPALIDAVPDARSNTTPPTLYTAWAGMAQVGALLMVAPRLDRAGDRWRGLWRRMGEAAVGIYVWHLTALAICVVALAAGATVPERLTWPWWATRPLWWVAVLTITGLLVGVTAFVRSGLARRSEGGLVRSAGPARPATGVAVATLAAAVVGLRGPRTVTLAVICTALFVGSWWLLSSPTTHRPVMPRPSPRLQGRSIQSHRDHCRDPGDVGVVGQNRNVVPESH
jgi:hypothetical protein